MVRKFAKQLAGNRKGQGLVEYGILAAGIALVGLISVSVLGHKAGDMLGTVAAILPGTQAIDNAPVEIGYLVETSQDSLANGAATLDGAAIGSNDNGTIDRLGENIGFGGSADDGLILSISAAQ